MEGVCGTLSDDSSSVPGDHDVDGICNQIDDDDDNDGWIDDDDAFPYLPTEWLDTDGDE